MVVRKCFTEIVSESGLLMSSFPSIDEDARVVFSSWP